MTKGLSAVVRPAALLAVVMLLAAGGGGGCRKPYRQERGTERWIKTVNSIKPGTKMSRVRSALGPPDVKRQGETPLRPYPPIGSPEGVLGTLAPETRYEQWIYKRGDSHFHVFFTRGTRGDDGVEWEVLTVRSVPRDAVD